MLGRIAWTIGRHRDMLSLARRRETMRCKQGALAICRACPIISFTSRHVSLPGRCAALNGLSSPGRCLLTVGQHLQWGRVVAKASKQPLKVVEFESFGLAVVNAEKDCITLDLHSATAMERPTMV